MHAKLILFSPFGVLASIHAHAHLAVLGWFVLMIVGVSYRLIPMFTLSAIQSSKRAWTAYALLNFGILSVFFGLLFQKSWLPLAAIILVLGLGMWMWEMYMIYHKRNRAHLDGPLKQVRLAMLHIPVLILLGLWLSLPRNDPSLIFFQIQTSYGLLALLGFISLFIIAMLYKIIPFLVWYQVYASLVGKQPVPKLDDLYSHFLERWSARIFVAGVWFVSIACAMAPLLPIAVLQCSAVILAIGISLAVFNLGTPLLRLTNQFGCPIAKFYMYLKQKITSRLSMAYTIEKGVL
jgi:hypothetical protein